MHVSVRDRRIVTPLLVVATAALLAVAAAGCGSSSSSSSSDETAATGASQGEEGGGGGEGSGGTLVVDTSFVTKSLDPQRSFEPTSYIAVKATYDTLLTFEGGDTEPKPWLAESYTVSDDGTTYTFKLREDVTFSDGTPLTSADVVYSYQRSVNLKGSPSFLLADVEVSAPDPYTVVLTSKVPNPALLRIVENPSLGIVNSKVVTENGGADGPGADKEDTAEAFLNAQSAGSGPYVLKQYEPSQQIVLEANPRFWGPKPTFESVVIRNMPGPTQLLNVQRGTNEIALDLSAQQAVPLSGTEGLTVDTSPSANVFNIDITTDAAVSPVASNPNIQTAIRYALDYEAFVQLSGEGAVQAPGIIPSVFLGALPAAEAVKRDLEKAKAEVAASGIENPSIVLTYPSELTVNGISFATLAQKVKANLEEAGIGIELEGKPVAAFLDSYVAGEHQMSQSYWSPDYPDPNDYLVFLPGGHASLRVHWTEDKDPELYELGQRASTTIDDEERGQLFQEIGRQMNERAPLFPLFQPAQAVVYSGNLTGVALSPVWVLDVRAVGTR